MPRSRRREAAKEGVERGPVGLCDASPSSTMTPEGVMAAANLERARTSVLDIAYEEHGPASGDPVMLMHGWPYDPRTYDEVAPRLAAAGCRAIVPYLRGFGPTRFLSPDAPRSGQQAALGNDLKEFMDAL